MKPIGLVNGEIVDLQDNVIPMEDRGHQFGDGVYEVTRVYNGKCFTLEPHMNRLYRSLRELRIPATYSYEELADFHELLINKSGIKDGAIYLQITRGVAVRTHNFPEQTVPRLTMSIREAAKGSETLRDTGVRVISIPDERWLRCDIKSLNLLGNVLGKQRAKEAGCYEAIMIRDGKVTEGTSSNFCIIKDGLIWTYPATNLILKGITRTIVLEQLAPQLDVQVIEKAFDLNFALNADEAFLSGTSTEVMPVTHIDGKPVNGGVVGPITRKLQTGYSRLIAQQCGE